jgi:hypothetical protein
LRKPFENRLKNAWVFAVADVRILLNDKAIVQLPTPKEGWYLARNTELKGFFVVVGKRKRTFTVQGDLRLSGKRASSIRVAIGNTDEMSTRTARATAKDYLAQISRGQHPKKGKCETAADAKSIAAGDARAAAGDVTLRQAWERYRTAHLIRSHLPKIVAGFRFKDGIDVLEAPANHAA